MPEDKQPQAPAAPALSNVEGAAPGKPEAAPAAAPSIPESALNPRAPDLRAAFIPSPVPPSEEDKHFYEFVQQNAIYDKPSADAQDLLEQEAGMPVDTPESQA